MGDLSESIKSGLLRGVSGTMHSCYVNHVRQGIVQRIIIILNAIILSLIIIPAFNANTKQRVSRNTLNKMRFTINRIVIMSKCFYGLFFSNVVMSPRPPEIKTPLHIILVMHWMN